MTIQMVDLEKLRSAGLPVEVGLIADICKLALVSTNSWNMLLLGLLVTSIVTIVFALPPVLVGNEQADDEVVAV